MATKKATLLHGINSSLISRTDLESIPVPESTRTHQPVSHFKFVNHLEEALSMRSLAIVREEFAVSKDGMKMFGVLDLDAQFSDCRFSIGLRNANDKSMRLALTAGLRVLVCDNMAFSGDFTPLSQRHSKSLNLRDSISVAVDRIHRNFEPLRGNVETMKRLPLAESEAKVLIYEAFVEGVIPGLPKHLLKSVHKNFFEPEYPEFEKSNIWTLSNAFTSSFKELRPMKQFELTARLGQVFSSLIGETNTGAMLRKVVTEPVLNSHNRSVGAAA